MDWRSAYLQNVESELQHLQRLIDTSVDMTIEDEYGDTVRISEADRSALHYHARREAEKSVQDAINRWNEKHA